LSNGERGLLIASDEHNQQFRNFSIMLGSNLGRILDVTRAILSRAQLRSAELRGAVTVHGKLWIHGGGTLYLGAGVKLDGGAQGIELYVRRGATLSIGDNVSVGAGTSIEACNRIDIGGGSKIGRFCKLLDNNLHLLVGQRHDAPQSADITVEPDVAVGDYVILLPGTRLGRAARVGNGAVVSRRVPAGATVPPRFIHPARLA
jgi:maltose O-acetyltransferase